MAKERRKRTRVPVAFDINIIFQKKKIKVQTFNISLTGISCTSDPQFRANEPCEVILTLNEDASLDIAGKILRIDEKEAIITFLSMDEDTFFHLKRIMEYNAADADEIDQELKKPAFLGK
ncbi:MAG: PilZ domain-containing protein [Smithellaceae bacterium]